MYENQRQKMYFREIKNYLGGSNALIRRKAAKKNIRTKAGAMWEHRALSIVGKIHLGQHQQQSFSSQEYA